MKAAVIGAGHISRQHLACLGQLPNVELAAVCDLSRVMAESAAERFSVSAWYTDHHDLLSQVRPDVVHVTTPASAHFRLAKDALDSGAHVILEKPATPDFEEIAALLDQAKSRNLILVEDYNYLFNRQIRRMLDLAKDGSFGSLLHVEVIISLQIVADGNPFVDPNVPHPFQNVEGGAIFDFLPHLASLANAFLGRHQAVRTIWTKRSQNHQLPSDEFRALVQAERGTASLVFSAHSQPDVFLCRVHGTKMRAECNLFETRLTTDQIGRGPKPLRPFFSALKESRQVRRAAFGGVWRKLDGGPGAYEGLWELLAQTYASLQARTEPPVGSEQIREVNRLVRDLRSPEYSF